jgi:hypothetical protein
MERTSVTVSPECKNLEVIITADVILRLRINQDH